METVLAISCHWLSETPGTGYDLETERSESLLGFLSPLQTIYLIEHDRRSLCKDFNSCFELFALLVMGRIKISNKELVLESALYIHKQTWKKERLKKKSKIKILPRPGLFIIHHSEFLDESLWEMQKT